MYEDFFADRMASLRMKRSVSAREMSLTIGQNESYINRIENKQTFPSMQWCNVAWMYLAGVLGMFGLSVRILQSRYFMYKQQRLEKAQAEND